MDVAQEANRPWHHHRTKLLLGVIGAYLLIAYIFLPQLGKFEARRHPMVYDSDRITKTSTGLAGDPVNVAIVGNQDELIRAMHAAGWVSADALTFEASVKIVTDTVLNRPDPNAPVSNLFLFGRREDLAFEKPIGHSPRQRHHVRFWKASGTHEGRPVWIGAATLDTGVEISRETGQVTHHISPDIDAERELLVGDLQTAGQAAGSHWVEGFHHGLSGKNGGGDPWRTDGRLAEVTLKNSSPGAGE